MAYLVGGTPELRTPLFGQPHWQQQLWKNTPGTGLSWAVFKTVTGWWLTDGSLMVNWWLTTVTVN